MFPVAKCAPLFSRLDEGALRRLLGRCLQRRYKAGETVFQAGEPAAAFYLVLSGRVKVYRISARGEEQILHLYGPGRTFGEAAMWGRAGYPAFAEAVRETALLVVSYASLRQAVAEEPELAMGMMAGLSSKLQEFVRLIEDLSLKEVPARLAGALLKEARKAGSPRFRLAQTKRELAAQLGTVPETLSRALSKLRKSGAIEVSGAVIRIAKPEALKKLSEEAP
jgi:CRP/FNR family transcriptional regulator